MTDTIQIHDHQDPAAHRESAAQGSTICYWPSTDVAEREDAVLVFADMPGLAAENIRVTLENGVLGIHGVAHRQASGRLLLEEYVPGDYFRSFRVGSIIDQSRISATYHNGVLQLTLGKLDVARPRQIPVG